jgi:cysteinyl-tRNA synthetase
MKVEILLIISLIFLSSCNRNEDSIDTNDSEFKEKMRDFVIGISQYSKSVNPNFLIVPQNGIELVSSSGDVSGTPHTAYLKAIDANGQEDLFYGYDKDDQATSTKDNNYLTGLLNISKNEGNTILVTDYCSNHQKIENSYLENIKKGYISFAANQRELNNIPNFPNPIHQENNEVVTDLSKVKNFLYLINSSNFATKNDFINSVTSTNYDLLIMDLYFNDGNRFTPAEINLLKNKANGGKRLIICYMSIGEAENYRYYWQPSWNSNKPSWLDAENPNWVGNYKVKYWDTEWQSIIYGNDNSYLKQILEANFDGVYLDIVDAFEYFEK